MLARPERTLLVVAHSLPLAFALAAADGTPPRPRAASFAYATPHLFEHARARAAAVGVLEALARRARLVSATLRSMDILARIEEQIRGRDLIEPGGRVLCFVSGGADSTCLAVALAELGYDVAALHVNHGQRGAESDADARFCAEQLGAEVVDARGAGSSEAELRAIRYAQRPEQLRATGHTASDQVETILFRLVSSGNTQRHQGASRGRRRSAAAHPLA